MGETHPMPWCVPFRLAVASPERGVYGHAEKRQKPVFDFPSPWRFCPQQEQSHDGHQFPNPRHRSRCARNTVGLVAKVEAQFASALIPDLIS